MWLAAGMAVGSAILAGVSAASKTDRENRALKARQVLMEEERRHRRQLFRVQTFSEFYDTNEAGAARINRVLATGSRGYGMSTLNQAAMAGMERNKFMRQFVLRHQEAQVQSQLATMEGQKQSVAGQGFLAAAESGIGVFGSLYTPSGEDPLPKGGKGAKVP